MFDKIIAYSIKNKFVVGLFLVALIIWGGFSVSQLPIDAVPDITNNQVQIITISPTLATQEVEQFITTPIELSLQNLQRVEEIRSISRFGLSVVTVVFDERHDVYLARQLVTEQLKEAEDAIPEGLGTPEMAPLSTGLGEIYQYVVRPLEGYEDQYSPTELRTIQDWIVKRQLSGIEGVAEINSMGGFLKQYEVAVDPMLLKSMSISITEVFEAMEMSNENTGGAYIEKTANSYYIRSEGIAKSLEDISNIVINDDGGTPILIGDVATLKFGKAPRYGALVRNGEEVVGGRVMMFKGANSARVTAKVRERVEQIQTSLPEGVIIEPYLVRDKLIKTAIGTVEKNLIEGGLIVIFILVLMLGNWRAGLIVASVIPLAMLFAIAMMNTLGISANLMSLGAIDFGLIVDGAVIIVESIVHRIQTGFAGKTLTKKEMDREVLTAAQKIRNSAAFGEIIILMVYIPILALVGIEGKMFKPMAQTVMLAIAGALILSLTYVPMMSALFLKRKITNKKTIADRIMNFLKSLYKPVLNQALKHKRVFVVATVALFAFSAFTFNRMGAEFIPTLEEGDLAMQHILPPGSSLSQSIETAKMIQLQLLEEFPEIEDIVVNIGAAEIPTDPMPVEIGDYVLVMKPKKEWTSASNRQEMFEKLEESLHNIPGIGHEFSQPIQLRFNELMTGTKADIAIKLYGDDLDLMYAKAKEAEKIISDIPGIGTVNVEQTIGMPQIVITYKYQKMAQYGLHIKEVNQVIRSAFAGEKAGVIYEGERRFDLVIRLDESYRRGIDDVEGLFITLTNGSQIPLTAVADVRLIDAPMQISRDNTNRRTVIGVNVGRSDVASLVKNIQSKLSEEVDLPPGYYFSYGGQFENLKAAQARLGVAVPIALAMIFVLLFFTFGSVSEAVLIFTAIPLSAIGGVWSLQLRGMPFSISAGIGFIALFGVAVLNGIVLIGYFNQLKKEGVTNIRERILKGTDVRLRPVIMTAAVASLGFLPMALSKSGGAEVQRPLATVVIGGLITATFLTLIVLPILYSWLANWQENRKKPGQSTKVTMVLLPLMLLCSSALMSQPEPVSMESAVQTALENNHGIKAAELTVEKTQLLQDMRYNPGPTEIGYEGEALFQTNTDLVNQLNVSQTFDNLGLTRANNAIQRELLTVSQLNKRITEKELTLQVQQLYLDLQYEKKLLSLYDELTETYRSYLEKAEKRVEVGEANVIEELSLRSQLNQYILLQEQIRLKVFSLEDQLRTLLNVENKVTASEELSVVVLEEMNKAPAIWIQQSKQQILVENAMIKAIKAERNPSFNVGYAAQKFYDGGWRSGLMAGLEIPLFNSQNRKRAEAQKVQVEITTARTESLALQFDQKLVAALNALDLYQKGMVYYQDQVESINPELARIAELNYKAGELSYLELLNVLQLSAQNQIGYWEQVLEYNKAVINYQFLTNQ